MKKETALSYIIEKRSYSADALAMALQIKKENREQYRKVVSSNKIGRDKANISNYCNRKRKILTEDYIEIIEDRLRVPREYWLITDELDAQGKKNKNKGYTKRLTVEVKKEIDEFFRNEIDKKDNLLFEELNVYPLQKELLQIDTNMLFDTLIHTIKQCIYDKDDEFRDEYIYLQRTQAILDVITEVKRIGVDNMDKCLKILKEYQPKKPKGMTEEEIQEYEMLFGKIVKED